MDDAEAAVDVLRRAICELCTADHGDDPSALEPWLANKTPEHFKGWLAQKNRLTIVAEHVGQLCGVGMLGTDGVIDLCYVHPEHVRRGVGRALMEAMEARARQWGLERLKLESTITAKRFYEAMGFRPSAAAAPASGVDDSLRYEKPIV